MQITIDTNCPGVTLLAADDYSWRWDQEVEKFRHEDEVTLATFEEVLAMGSPVSLVFDDVTKVA